MDEQQANLKIQQLFSAHSNGDFQQVLNIALELQKHFPKFILGYKAAGVALVSMNQKQQAIKHLKTAVNLDSNDAEALSNLGQTLIELIAEKNNKNDSKKDNKNDGDNDKKDLLEAEKYLKKAVKLTPNSAVVNNNLANVYFSLKDFDKAEFFANQAINIDKNYSLAYQNLGLTYYELYEKNNENNLLSKAKINLQNALNLSSDHLINLDKIYLFLGKIAIKETYYLQAEKYFSKVIELNIENPTKYLAISELLSVYYKIGESSKAYDLSQKYYANKNNIDDDNGLHILIDNYCENLGLADIKNTVNNYYNSVAKHYKPLFDYKKFYKNANKEILKHKKVLNIGFVSGDLNFHAVSYFIFGLFKELKNSNAPFNLYTFNTQEHKHDANSEILNNYIDKSFNISNLDDKKAAQLIHKQNIDILFDLSGHTEFNRLFLFTLKPAPIQVTWIGWLASLGIPGIDYFLVDKFCVPNEEKYEQQFTEKVYRFPNIWEVYTPTVELNKHYKIPNTTALNKPIKLANFASPSKVTNFTLRLWASVLKAIPNSKFLYMRIDVLEPALQDKIKNTLISFGANPDQIQIVANKIPTEYIQAYSKVDFVLDTYPCTGMTTTAEALCMGVPVLTLLGERMPSRLSGSCLNAVGLNEWICQNEAEFVEKAKYFSDPQQRDYLQNLHKTLRERTLKSPLCDTQKLSREFEKAMWHFWHTFVDSL